MILLIFIKQHLSNISTFEVHEKNKQRWGWLEKNELVIKEVCISLVPTMKAYLIHFFVLSWIWSCFCANREKIRFPRQDFVDCEMVIWGLTSLTDFHKRVYLLFKKRHVSDFQKKIYFAQITSCKILIFFILKAKALPSVN